LERVARDKGHPVPPDGMFLIHRPAGIDLTRAEDAAWLLERVTAHQPDLLICGPFYRLHAAASEEEGAARKVVAALDAARVQADCALVVEHHAPHGGGANGARSIRPFGSSLLMRWPEMGMGIVPAADELPCRHVMVKAWRGNRDERHWPKALSWGSGDTDWPWVVDVTPWRAAA
jgi:AAA domain